MELAQNDARKKERLIEKLISFGIYKKGNLQLFELPLKELQEEMERHAEINHKEGES